MSSTVQSSLASKITVADVLAGLRRHLALVILPPVLLLALAVAYLLVAHRYYQSSSRIELNGSSAPVTLDRTGGNASTADALEVNTFLQTQVQILQSEAIALHVIHELNLEQTPTFRMTGADASVSGGSLESSPKRLDHMLGVFQKNLSVQIIPATHLIEVRYTDRDPNRAAAVVNDVVQSLVAYNDQTRSNASSQVNGFLGQELAALRKHSEDLQNKLQAIQQRGGVLSSNGVNAAGQPESYSPAIDRVRGASELLLQAETNAILKQAVYNIAKDGNAEAISTLSGTALANSSSGVNSSFASLQALRAQEATLQQQLDQARTRYGARFPKLIELQSSLDAVQRSIKAEVQRIGDRAKSDYQVAQVTESADRKIYESARQDAVELNGRAAEYGVVKQEADQSRKLYEDLLGHVQEAGLLQGLHASTVTVVDPARPTSKPSRPNSPLILAGALFAGLFFGLVGAFAAETLGDSMDSVRAIGGVAGAPALALLPKYFGASPSESFAEAIRTLRARLLGAPDLAGARTLLIASSVHREGRTTVALDLARALAQHGRRVLLIEADLRNPTLNRLLPAHDSGGLAEMLAGSATVRPSVPFPESPDLAVFGAGHASGSATDLLDSPLLRSQMAEWRSRYDLILLDSPPVLSCADALELARLADRVLFVVRESAVSRTQLQAALENLLGVISADKISTVVNAVRNGSHAL